MFDLEEEIAVWRRQMLVADIETPAPLDELEGHLREDVELEWPRYRRASLGIIAFLLNSAVLVWIFAMVVLSLIAAGNLAHHDP